MADRRTPPATFRIERRFEQLRTTYRVVEPDGTYVDSLTFREVLAIVAADAGRVSARWHRTYSPWFYDQHLRLECEDHGIGYGTLYGLQRAFSRPAYIEQVADAGPVGLTPFGREVFAQLKALTAGTDA